LNKVKSTLATQPNKAAQIKADQQKISNSIVGKGSDYSES
jgi:hypothetical protein